jgi:DNA primase
MSLLEIAKELGLEPVKVSSTSGGEFHSSCPECGGADRFCLWPEKKQKKCSGSYWCRQCDIRGDSIQFCRDFLGMDFKDACRKVHAAIEINKADQSILKPKDNFKPVELPPKLWREKVGLFIDWAHKQIKSQADELQFLSDRGLPLEAVESYKIGYSINIKAPHGDFFRDLEEFGLPDEKKPDGTLKRLWIPSGIVIPTIEPSGEITRLKIRRRNWKPDDKFPKYVALKGSMLGMNLIGDVSKELMIVVESELDGYSLHWAAKEFAFIVSVGSNLKTPDNVTNHLARTKKRLLIAHDNDSAGVAMLKKWRRIYPHAIGCPVPLGKDVGEAVQNGIDIKDWLLSLIR